MSIIAPVKPFFKYSMELQSQVPVVAYYCKLYGVNKGLELMRAAGGEHKEVKNYLMTELADLEKLKAALEGSTKDDQKIQIENFVLSIFAQVDKAERTCETVTKQNAIDFKRCSDFIALLSLFGQMEPEWKEREKYCKYKAGTILKCIKNGEQPPRGNPFAKEEEEIKKEEDNFGIENDPTSFGVTPGYQSSQTQNETQLDSLTYASNAQAQSQSNLSSSQNPYTQSQNQYSPITPVYQPPQQQYQPTTPVITPQPQYQPPQQQQQQPTQHQQQPQYQQPSQQQQAPSNTNTYHTNTQQIPQQQQQQQQYQYSQQTQQQPKSASARKDQAYYKAVAEAKKKAQSSMSELDFGNVQNAVKFLQEALAILQPIDN